MALHPLEYETLLSIRAAGLLPVGGRVVVGVSGGGDSLALLLVLAAIRPELALELTAVYVDHGLRPSETAAEIRLVAKVAAALGVACRSVSVAVRSHALQHGLSLEAAGRELRYGVFRQVAAELGGAAVAVAHHADDQAESVLLRLVRGTGRAGLAGMRSVNEAGVIRPLLHFPRARLREYLQERQLSGLTDSSNADPRFLRNRVRLELLPFLAERFNPAIRATLGRTAEILAAEEQLLAELAESFYRQTLVGDRPDELAMDAVLLLNGHLALRRRAVELALLAMGAPVRFRQVEALLALAGEPGGELHLPGGLRVGKAAGRLFFSYPAGRVRHRGRLAPPAVAPFAVAIDGPGRWPMAGRGGELLVEILPIPPSPAELRAGGADYLDLAGLSFPLLARPPRPGDRFHPLGAPGSRKVADFLCDRKFPAAERARLVVLESGGRVAALVGQRIDHACRITAATGKVLKVILGG